MTFKLPRKKSTFPFKQDDFNTIDISSADFSAPSESTNVQTINPESIEIMPEDHAWSGHQRAAHRANIDQKKSVYKDEVKERLDAMKQANPIARLFTGIKPTKG